MVFAVQLKRLAYSLTSKDLPSPWPAFGEGQLLPVKLGVDECASFVTDRMSACARDHSLCTPIIRSSVAPSRLLDLGDSISEQPPLIRLVEMAPETKVSYNALSYRWGNAPKLRTTKSELQSFLKCIPWLSIPRRFQEAIALTKRLGIRFLWIDALCIVQDDPEDWVKEAANMAKIYASSYLTLSITHSTDDSSPCFSPRICPEENSFPYRFSKFRIEGDYEGEPFCIWARSTPYKAHDQLLDEFLFGNFLNASSGSPLLSRAWVFQERLLAPRTLHFHATELVWECDSCMHCECGGINYTCHKSDTPAQSIKLDFKRECNEPDLRSGSPQAWTGIICLYSRLRLTFESDRLPALSGLASQHSERIPSLHNEPLHEKVERNYLAGHWREGLELNLLWDTFGKQEEVKRLVEPCAPSWSWASIDHSFTSGIWYGKHHTKRFKDPRLQILDAYCCLAGSNRFGCVSGGLLSVSAAYITASLDYDNAAIPVKRAVLVFNNENTSFYFDLHARKILEGTPGVGTILYCLLFATESFDEDIGLVLQTDQKDPDRYRRVGIFQLESRGWFDSAEIGVFNVI